MRSKKYSYSITLTPTDMAWERRHEHQFLGKTCGIDRATGEEVSEEFIPIEVRGYVDGLSRDMFARERVIYQVSERGTAPELGFASSAARTISSKIKKEAVSQARKQLKEKMHIHPYQLRTIKISSQFEN